MALHRNYPCMVMSDLKRGMLTGRSKTKFVASIAAAIFRFKSYPTKDEYEHVSQLIISAYPFLKSSSGSGYVRSLNLATNKIAIHQEFSEALVAILLSFAFLCRGILQKLCGIK